VSCGRRKTIGQKRRRTHGKGKKKIQPRERITSQSTRTTPEKQEGRGTPQIILRKKQEVERSQRKGGTQKMELLV